MNNENEIIDPEPIGEAPENIEQETNSFETSLAFSFRNRILAFFIDVLILTVIGYFLGLSLGKFAYQLGNWGLLIGFVITLLYFSIQNSYITHGRTIGKRITKLKVVDKNNNYLTVSKSTIRTLILITPYFLSDLPLEDGSVIGTILYSLLISLTYALFHFFVLNAKTRQSLHDYVSGSFVLNYNNSKCLESQKPLIKHYILFGIISTIVILVNLITITRTNALLITADPRFLKNVDKIERFDNYSINKSLLTTIEDLQTKKNLDVIFYLSNDPKYSYKVYEAKILLIAEQTLKYVPEVKNCQVLTIEFHCTYELGIWSSGTGYSVEKTIPDWEAELKKQENIPK